MKALGTIEVDILNLTIGDSMSFVWRRKPVFIRNRTQEDFLKQKKTILPI
jgi:hypothetical protein